MVIQYLLKQDLKRRRRVREALKRYSLPSPCSDPNDQLIVTALAYDAHLRASLKGMSDVDLEAWGDHCDICIKALHDAADKFRAKEEQA